MKLMLTILVAGFLIISYSLSADEQTNIASGKGVMADFQFQPKYSYAQTTGTGTKKQVWLLLTDQVPSGAWKTSNNKAEMLRQWCESKKAPFVLVELDSTNTPQLLTQCPGNGAIAMEMISISNGLPSVVLKFEVNDGKRLKGQLLGGNGYCGENTYCEPTKDYSFDTTFIK